MSTTRPDPAVAAWRKSTYSSDGENCVEVVDDHHDGVPVRDSKNPGRPYILFPAGAWSSFVTAVKTETPFA